MPEKRVKVMKKGTFENEIDGNKSLVTKEYVDQNAGDIEVLSYQEAMDILNGGGA